METKNAQQHVGRKINKLRELRGMKQEVLAEALGVSQQAVSVIERSAKVDEKKLEKIAEILGVSKEAIENFSEEAVFNIIGNTYNLDNHSSLNYGCTINPIDKIVELFEENKKLYEQLLRAEREKNSYLEKLLGK